MRTKFKFIFLLLLLYIPFFGFSQREKGTWGIGGSGFWTKTKSEGEKIRSQFDISADGQYFVLNNLSVGSEIRFIGNRTLNSDQKPHSENLFLSPFVECFLINNLKWGLSAKGLIGMNIYISNEPYKLFSNFLIGPKISYNITPSFSMFTWLAYRRLPDEFTVNFPGNTGAVFPSDNFDIRWGFSYFLPRKDKE